jgi:hypothetical protein
MSEQANEGQAVDGNAVITFRLTDGSTHRIELEAAAMRRLIAVVDRFNAEIEKELGVPMGPCGLASIVEGVESMRAHYPVPGARWGLSG